MIKEHVRIYEGNPIRGLGQILLVPIFCDGDIEEIHLKAKSVSDFSGDWYFNVYLNGAALFADVDRLKIEALDLAPSKIGLSGIAVTREDEVTLVLEAKGLGSINGPIQFQVNVEDGVEGGGSGGSMVEDITAAPADATPADTDEFGYVREDPATVFSLMKFTWADMKVALATAFASIFMAIDAALSALSDVNITTVKTGQSLRWNGTEWVNSSYIGTGHSKVWADPDLFDIAIGDDGSTVGGNGTVIYLEDASETISFSKIPTVPDEVYDSTNWDGDLGVPTKNAIRDKIEALIIGGGGYTDEQAQDAVGAIFDASLDYDDATGTMGIATDGVVTAHIDDEAVTNPKLALMPTMTVKGNDAVGSAAPQDLTTAELYAMLESLIKPIEAIGIAVSDETTALTVGNGKVTFRIPYAFTLTGIRASLTTAQASGSIFTADVNEAGVSILSTKLTIDNTEKTSTTAAAAPVISDASLADDAEITVDIDQVGDGTAKGLKIWLIGRRA